MQMRGVACSNGPEKLEICCLNDCCCPMRRGDIGRDA